MFNAWKVIDKFLAYSITKGNFSSFQVENEDIDNVIERLAKNKENFSLHDLTVAEKTIYTSFVAYVTFQIYK